ncbi:MAG: hypothetical protein H6832_12705 [Planctomycetes bacterium]|nr:hypothetical protein [Planctomycetota bacterium]
MRHPLVTALSALLPAVVSSSAVAQITAQWTATTDLTAAVIGSNGPGTFRLPKSSTLGSTNLGVVQPDARAMTSMSLTSNDYVIGFVITEFADARGAFTTTFAGRTGPHDTSILLKSAVPEVFNLSIRVTGNGTGDLPNQAWDYEVAVRVGSQVVVSESKYGPMRPMTIPIRLDPAGTIIRTRSGAVASSVFGVARSSLLLTLSVEPQPRCSSAVYGTSCQGFVFAPPQLDGRTSVVISVGPPLSTGLLAIGSKQLQVAIPGTNCWLYTDVPILLPFSTDFFGNAHFAGLIPVMTRGTFTTQAFFLPSTGLVSTHGVSITCP